MSDPNVPGEAGEAGEERAGPPPDPAGDAPKNPIKFTTLGFFEGPLWQLTLARWRSFYREPSAVFWTFGFPILLAMALGLAFRNKPPEPVAVCIQDGPGAEVLQLLRDAVSAYGQTTVMVTHDAHAAATADRVLYLADGRVVADIEGASEGEILETVKELA